jgi:MFS family permease
MNLIANTHSDLGISILNTACGLYLAELVPPYIRARTIGLCVASGNAVSVIAATAVWASEKLDNEQQYKIPLYIQVGFPVMLALLTSITEESPAWYMLRDREDKAREALMKLRKRNTEVVETELSLLRVFVTQDRARLQNVRFWEILNKDNLQRTITAGACWSLCQVGGQLLVLVYSTVVLIQSGVANPFQITVIIFLLSLVGGLVGGWLMDTVGRRPVALTGFTILFLLDVAIGGLACGPLSTNSQKIALAALFIIFAFFNSMSFLSL